MDAVVTDAHIRSSLAGIRGLGRAGLSVVALAPSRGSAGRLSRWRAEGAPAPDSAKEPGAHVAAVLEAARRHPRAVVYPSTEWSLSACFRKGGAELAGRLPYRDAGPLELLRDKGAMAQAASDAGLGVPAVHYAGPVRDVPVAHIPLPAIVKPRGAAAPFRSRPAPDRETLAGVVEELPPDVEVLVQECVDGALKALAVVVGAKGRLHAQFHQRALREWPAGAGASARAVGIEPDSGLTERVLDMLGRAGYRGLAQIQYLASARGPVVLDVNPRFYGSLPLALASGVNLPAIWHACVTGDDPGPAQPYRVGVTYRWLEADVVDALRGSPGWLRPLTGPRVGAWWSAGDPLPAAALTLELAAGHVRRRLRG